MLGVMSGSYYFQNKSSKDHEKIERIAESLGLYVTENKEKRKIRLYRKNEKNNCTEYVYKIPLGLSFKDFEDKQQVFIDGLNNKSKNDLELSKLKELKFNKDLPKQIRNFINNRTPLDKNIEMSYDGMLKIKVFDSGLPDMYPFEEAVSKCKGWEVPIGVRLDGKLIKHNFDKVAHVIDAGTTDFGKSNWMKSLITTLLINKPNDVTFSLIDLKEGLTFNRFKKLKQVESIATNPKTAYETLKHVQKKLDKIMQKLNAHGYEDVKEAGWKERHFILIDEAADIAEDDKCEEIIVDIARRGRAAGMRLVYATQYPTKETMSSQVKRNCRARLCFVLDTAVASGVVLDEGGAEKLPLIQGRAIYKTVRKEVIQTPYIDNKYIKGIIKQHERKGKDVSHQTKEDGTRGTDITVFEEA